jgi:hypothetical protein
MWIRSSKSLANPAVSVIVASCLAAASGSAVSANRTPDQAGTAVQTPPIVKPKEVAKATEDPSYKAFLDRVKEYVDLRKKLDDGLPHLKPTGDLQRVETHEQVLATVPPLLLLRLPKLPEGLEYRFMGRDLILHDTTANIIVDFLRAAAPTVPRKTGQKSR